MSASLVPDAIAAASPWPIALGAAFYFGGGHATAERQFIVELFADFARAHGDRLRWWLDPATQRWLPIGDARVDLDAVRPDEAWRLAVRGGDDPDAATLPLLDVTGMHDWGDRLGRAGYVEIGVDATTENVAPFRALVRRIALGTAAASAHAGLALVLPTDQALKRRARAVSALVHAHPGLDVYRATHHAPFVGISAIRSVGWLTWLGPALAARAAHELTAPPPGVSVEPAGGGLLVQAGDVPALGDAGHVPPAYALAGRWLRVLRATEYAPLAPGTDAFDRDETEAWLARFD